MEQKSGFRKYIIVTFTMAWILMIAASYFVLNGNRTMFTVLSSAAMFAPFVGTWATCGGLKKDKSGINFIPRFKGKIGWWLVSWFLFIVLSALGSILFFIIIPSSYDPGTMATFESAKGLTPVTLYLVQAASAVGAALLNALFAIGEETGWRGYMYPILKDRFGVTKGRILGGVIWGVWHWPMIFFAGYEYGWGFFNNPLLSVAGMFIFLTFTISVGIILDWMYTKTDCIWACALGHGAVNGSAAFGMLLINMEMYQSLRFLGPSCVGVLAEIPFFIAAAIICLKENKIETGKVING